MMGGKPDIQKYFIYIFVETLYWYKNESKETGSYNNYYDYLDFLVKKSFIDINLYNSFKKNLSD